MVGIRSALCATASYLLYTTSSAQTWDGPPLPANNNRPDVCKYWQLLNVGTEPGTCAAIKPNYTPDGSVSGYSGVSAGNYYTLGDPGMNKFVSKCNDITGDTVKYEAPTGDFVLGDNGCANNATGWVYLWVFSEPSCLHSQVKTVQRNRYLINPFPPGINWNKGKLFCTSPGFKVKSFYFSVARWPES